MIKLPLHFYLPSLLTTACSLVGAVALGKAGWWWFLPLPILITACSWFFAMIGAYNRGIVDEIRESRSRSARLEEQRQKAWLN